MFDPADFLVVARDLAVRGRSVAEPRVVPSAAYLRTAFGRAYYALYLLVRSEIARRHGINHRHLPHGALYTHLQSSRASGRVRELGRELQRMYEFRQKADYDLAPGARMTAQLEDTNLLNSLINRADEFAAELPHLDFSPVVPLFQNS
jgi:hypothetical protein